MSNLLSVAPYPLPAEDELPASPVRWEPDPSRAVLLVHDMQRYFLAPFLSARSPGEDLVANCARLVRRCSELAIPIAYSAQPGGMTAEERGLIADFWGPGMSADLADRDILDQVRPNGVGQVFLKGRYSAFHRTGLLGHIRGSGRDQLLVCGVYAHIGCLMTACDSFSHDIETFLVADAVADFTADDHRMALTYAAARCARVISTQAALDFLARTAPARGDR